MTYPDPEISAHATPQAALQCAMYTTIATPQRLFPTCFRLLPVRNIRDNLADQPWMSLVIILARSIVALRNVPVFRGLLSHRPPARPFEHESQEALDSRGPDLIQGLR